MGSRKREYIYTNLCVRVEMLRVPFRGSRFKNTVFYRCFRDFRGIPRGFSRLKSRRKPCVLSRFSRFSLPFEFGRFLVRFFEQVAKTTRFTASFGPRGRGSASVFSPFLHARFVNKCSKPRVFSRSLCKKVFKTTRFRALFAFPRPRHGLLVLLRPF